MSDPRYRELAHVLVHHSCQVQPGDRVLIEAVDVPQAFGLRLIRTVTEAGGLPFVLLKNLEITRALLVEAGEEQMRVLAEAEAALMAQMQAYIGIRGGHNVAELSDVPRERMALFEQHVFKKVHVEIRIRKTRWVVLRWPTPSMAQLAATSTAAFEDFYFQVCTLDYAKMSRALVPLQELMNQTDRVRLVAPGTDLTFSIAGIPAVACDGRHNIPDGEVFTAPVRDSIEGTIRFNAPSLYRGVSHEDVTLSFSQGRIVAAASSNTPQLIEVLDSDEGARYVGEFAIGFNPAISQPMNDILFDEKIAGSIHLTPGNAYKEAWNGNESQIHWDLVLMMAPEHGGGEIWFDDRLIRKDGRFVLPELEGLNPENLLG